jgi:hypothetical protein
VSVWYGHPSVEKKWISKKKNWKNKTIKQTTKDKDFSLKNKTIGIVKNKTSRNTKGDKEQTFWDD